jgi:hypothetical protein
MERKTCLLGRVRPGSLSATVKPNKARDDDVAPLGASWGGIPDLDQQARPTRL